MVFSEKPFTKKSIEKGATIWLYGNQHLEKPVMRASDYTMVVVDTECDMNVVLMVFKNSLESHGDDLKELYDEHW